jgi:hypothetical protein
MAKQKVLKFTLKGWVGRWVEYRQSDPASFVGAELKEEFEAPSVEVAIQITKIKIASFLEKNKQHAPDPEAPPGHRPEEEKTYSFDLTQHVWGIEFRLAQPAKPAKPAVAAVPLQPARAEETLYM